MIKCKYCIPIANDIKRSIERTDRVTVIGNLKRTYDYNISEVLFIVDEMILSDRIYPIRKCKLEMYTQGIRAGKTFLSKAVDKWATEFFIEYEHTQIDCKINFHFSIGLIQIVSKNGFVYNEITLKELKVLLW